MERRSDNCVTNLKKNAVRLALSVDYESPGGQRECYWLAIYTADSANHVITVECFRNIHVVPVVRERFVSLIVQSMLTGSGPVIVDAVCAGTDLGTIERPRLL